MQDGFYWIQVNNEKPRVIEVVSDSVKGVDVSIAWTGGFGITFLSGPLKPPEGKG